MAVGSPTETVVTFPAGGLSGASRVVLAVRDPARRHGGLLVATEATPFHPIDPSWPDQPDDRGWLTLADARHPVARSLMATFRADTGEVRLDTEIEAARGDAGVSFLVVHEVPGLEQLDPADLIGAEVTLEVDQLRRAQLSAAHTGCHLQAYAFNEVTDELWRKDAPRDSRGRRDFDAAAITSTRHSVDGSVDQYRLGKSLRKRGFDHPRLVSELDHYVAAANEVLRQWLASDAPAVISCDGPLLTSRRTWSCQLPQAPATMPCGGTHVRRLGLIAGITVSGVLDETGTALTLSARTSIRQSPLAAGAPENTAALA